MQGSKVFLSTTNYSLKYNSRSHEKYFIGFEWWYRAGAVSIFLGTTRDIFENQVVTYLAYEAYPEMAIECMKDIILQVSRMFLQKNAC